MNIIRDEDNRLLLDHVEYRPLIQALVATGIFLVILSVIFHQQPGLLAFLIPLVLIVPAVAYLAGYWHETADFDRATGTLTYLLRRPLRRSQKLMALDTIRGVAVEQVFVAKWGDRPRIVLSLNDGTVHRFEIPTADPGFSVAAAAARLSDWLDHPSGTVAQRSHSSLEVTDQTSPPDDVIGSDGQNSISSKDQPTRRAVLGVRGATNRVVALINQYGSGRGPMNTAAAIDNWLPTCGA